MKHHPHITLQVAENDRAFFATLLQSGAEYPAIQGQSLGDFISSLPEFTWNYLENSVQTIFLDGMPADDIKLKCFTKPRHTLALSAAMPGLVGAILKRNSLHVSLRTTTVDDSVADIGAPSIVRLKIFNSIAQERGPRLLLEGASFPTERLYKTFSLRQNLLKKAQTITCNESTITEEDLFDILLQHSIITLTVRPIDEN